MGHMPPYKGNHFAKLNTISLSVSCGQVYICSVEARLSSEALRRRLCHWPSWQGLIGWLLVALLSGLPSAYSLWKAEPLPTQESLPVVDAEKADSLTLLALPGLTPRKVSRILQLRTQLGGFWEKEELEALLDSTTWAQVEPFLTVQEKAPPFPAPLNLNALDSAALVEARLCRPSAARSLVRFRYKVGGFTAWAQIDSLYALNALERYRLRRYTELGPYAGAASKRGRVPSSAPSLVDINRASAEELEKLPGIGLKTAERIVRYRERLRYFISLEQLQEVWGMRPENLEKALPRLKLGPPNRAPLSLRYAPAETLAAHPYISWRLARQLIRHRQNWGDRPIPPEAWHTWLPDSVRPRLLPYLTGE